MRKSQRHGRAPSGQESDLEPGKPGPEDQSLISSATPAWSLQRLGPPGLWLQCPSPAPHLALSQASAMSPPLRALFLLALGLGLAGTLNPKDPNTCSFWER